jgi:hypothetical protein
VRQHIAETMYSVRLRACNSGLCHEDTIRERMHDATTIANTAPDDSLRVTPPTLTLSASKWNQGKVSREPGFFPNRAMGNLESARNSNTDVKTTGKKASCIETLSPWLNNKAH